MMHKVIIPQTQDSVYTIVVYAQSLLTSEPAPMEHAGKSKV